MKDFESIGGSWWFPEKPEELYIGLLSFSVSNGFTLEFPCIDIDLQKFVDSTKSAIEPTTTLRGFLQDGRHVSLFNCYSTGFSLSFPGKGKTTYKSSLGYLGKNENLPDLNSPVKALLVSYSHLRDWVAENNCEMTPSSSENQIKPDINFRYSSPEDKMLKETSDAKIYLTHIFSARQPSANSFLFEHDCALKIELKEPLTILELFADHLFKIYLFLSFCLNRKILTKKLQCKIVDSDYWFDIFYAQDIPEKPSSEISPIEMLLPLPTIEKQIPTPKILNTWLSITTEEKSAISLLINLLEQNKRRWTEMEFLQAVQALEIFSRLNATKDYELDEKEFCKRMTVCRESISDKKTLKWLERKLKYANRRYFPDLLQELVSNVGEYINALAPNEKAFLADIKNNRNIYTHRTYEASGALRKEGRELFFLTQGVICLLRATILRRLGFSSANVNQLLANHHKIGPLTSLVAEQYKKI